MHCPRVQSVLSGTQIFEKCLKRTSSYLKTFGNKHFWGHDDFPTLVVIKFLKKPMHSLILKSLQKRFSLMCYGSLFNGHTYFHFPPQHGMNQWRSHRMDKYMCTHSIIECPNMICTYILIGWHKHTYLIHTNNMSEVHTNTLIGIYRWAYKGVSPYSLTSVELPWWV